MKSHNTDTIVAAATPVGGALSLIRLSGPDALCIADKVFRSSFSIKKTVSSARGFSILYGDIVGGQGGMVGENVGRGKGGDIAGERGEKGDIAGAHSAHGVSGEVIDDVLVSVFRAPKSYTGEDMVEISCHGSPYIVGRIVELLVGHGARVAGAGEFTTRAFLAGKIDLSQAEAVADMISSRDRATHSMALTQMRGGYSAELKTLRAELLRLASLLELELDFAEEDVEFADRRELSALADSIKSATKKLADSFSLGNAIKKGIGVAIVGSPNVGKSTLLNALLNEERAMVSDIAGTTRDVIEETVTLDGVEYRFIDTAGIRESADRLEQMGIERTWQSIAKASVVLYVVDSQSLNDVPEPGGQLTCASVPDVARLVDTLIAKGLSQHSAGIKSVGNDGKHVCIVLNKCDSVEVPNIKEIPDAGYSVIPISAKYGINISAITDYLKDVVDKEMIYRGEVVVSNARHYEALLRTGESLDALTGGIRHGLPGDLLAQEVRQSLYWLGTITGEITTGEILSEIFSKFCIGK